MILGYIKLFVARVARVAQAVAMALAITTTRRTRAGPHAPGHGARYAVVPLHRRNFAAALVAARSARPRGRAAVHGSKPTWPAGRAFGANVETG